MPTQTIIGSDGAIECYNDPYGEVDEVVAAQAKQVEDEIVTTKNAIEGNFLRMAFLLDVFDDHKLYLGRGFPDMKSWAGSDQIELGWRVVIDLLRIRREVYPIIPGDNDQKIAVLSAAKVSKIRTLLPLLSDGDTDRFLDLLYRAPEMSWNDLRREVKELRTGESADDPDPVVFTAKRSLVPNNDGLTIYEISANDGIKYINCGKLVMPTDWTGRWNERFGRFLKET